MTVEECLAVDRKGKVAKAKSKIKVSDCDPNRPEWPALETDPDEILEHAIAKELWLIHEIFGTDLEGTFVKADKAVECSKDSSKLQAKVAKGIGKLISAKLKTFNACKKNALKVGKEPLLDGAQNRDQLEDACTRLDGAGIPDTKGKIAKERAKLEETLNKAVLKTPHLDLYALFPGCNVGTPKQVADCIYWLIECKLCLLLNTVDGLEIDCDLFDNGLPDTSCGGPPPTTTTTTTTTTLPPSKVVFLTSTTHTGDFGGLAAADAICAARASAAGLSGTFLTWLADDTQAPATRFTQSAIPYVRTDGAVVADDWADLTDGTIQNPINVDEFGVPPSTLFWAWTDVDTDGSMGPLRNCLNWTTASLGEMGANGLAGEVDSDWTTGWHTVCSNSVRLYCFEQ